MPSKKYFAIAQEINYTDYFLVVAHTEEEAEELVRSSSVGPYENKSLPCDGDLETVEISEEKALAFAKEYGITLVDTDLDEEEEDAETCCVCGMPAEGDPECQCACPLCQSSCFNDVTIADHGRCYDCHQKYRMGTSEDQLLIEAGKDILNNPLHWP